MHSLIQNFRYENSASNLTGAEKVSLLLKKQKPRKALKDKLLIIQIDSFVYVLAATQRPSMLPFQNRSLHPAAITARSLDWDFARPYGR